MRHILDFRTACALALAAATLLPAPASAATTVIHAGHLIAEPGKAGRLFFTSGPQGGARDRHPANNPLMRSNDGGRSFAPVPGVFEVHAVGFGKGTGGAPAVLIVGWIRGEYGVWRSEDDCATWTRLGDYPLGILAEVSAISGDGDDPAKVYLGFRGAGYAYYR